MNINNTDAQQSINKRIKSIIEYSGKTINSLSKDLRISQPALRSMVIGEYKPGFEMLTKLIEVFPEIDINWLITGNGEMLRAEASAKNTQSSTTNKNVIKYYPSVSGSMGGVQFLDDPSESYVDIILPGFSECKYAINAYGDSMHPVIKSGQVVILMEWMESFIDWGRIYLVVTKSGYRTIKYLKPSDNKDAIRCESENKELNPAFDINKEDIQKLFLVKGWVCRDTI